MSLPVKEADRPAWKALADSYSFLYGMTVQARLATQRDDVMDWWWLGRGAGPTPGACPTAGPSHASVTPPDGTRRSDPPAAPPTVTEPEPHGETPFTSLPPAVRQIIGAVALEYCVSIGEIMSFSRRGRFADARQECYRRLRAMPWCGDHPSLLQIGIWLHRDHTTVHHGLRKKQAT